MLTIFTLPKPFTDRHIRLIQRNAIASWKKLHPDIDIILMGDDAGIAEAAREFDVRHSNVRKNGFGTPLLDSAFKIAAEQGRFDTLMYVNADIVFLPDLIASIQTLKKERVLSIDGQRDTGDLLHTNIPSIDRDRQRALVVGRRIDVDIANEIDFNTADWVDKLAGEARSKGALHSWAGIDYFIFTKGMFADLPPFAVGRVGWDNWMIAESRRRYRYTIDATACITAIHQNHGYSGNNAGASRKTNPEAVKNNSFTKSAADACTIEDTNWRLMPSGLKRKHFSRIPALKRNIKAAFKH